MATTTIGVSDLSKLRGSQYTEDLAMYITPLVVVQTATVTAVPTFSPYVTLTVTWGGATTGVKIGQLVKIAGSSFKAWAMVRKAPSGTTFYISEVSIGSAGTSARIESAIQIGDTVTIYSFKPLKSMYSRIANKVFYKQWDLPYTNQNSQPPPVANTGPWQAARLQSGETTSRFTLPKSGVNTSFALGSATISSKTWTLPAGVTLVSGYALTDTVIQVDAIAGNHLVEYQVTDSNSKTHSAFLWLFVSDSEAYLSLDEQFTISGLSATQTRQGVELSFEIVGENLNEYIYPGAAILLREWTKFDGEYLTEGVSVDTFVAYISEIDISHDGNVGTALVTALSPYLYAELLVQPPQALEEKASPTRWTDCTSSLSNPRGFLYYLIKWHTPNLLDMHDFDAPHTTPRRRFGEFGNTTLQANMNVVAEYIAGNVGSAADGSIVLRNNPLYMSNVNRNNVDTVMTFVEQDISPEIKYLKTLHQKFAEAYSGAFAFNGSKIKAWKVGKRWYGGAGQATLPNFTVTDSEGLTRAKEVVGHFMAEQNADMAEIIFTLNGLQDVIDPAYMLWCAGSISSEYDTYGDGFNDRFLPLRVEREWEFSEDSGWLKTIRLALQVETFGQPGEEIPVANLSSYQLGGFSIATPIIFEPNQQGIFGSVPLMIAHKEDGKLAISYNYMLSSPTWTDLTPFVDDEIVNDWCLDYGSPYFVNGNNANYALGLYVITTSGSTLTVWYFENILDSLAATVNETVSMSDSSCETEARIEVSEQHPDLIIVAWHDQTGTRFVRSTNGGASWSSEANVGDTITDTENDNAPIGLAVYSQTQIISAPNATSEYGLYIATTAGGAFNAVTSTERDATPQPLVKLYSTSAGYVTQPATTSAPLPFVLSREGNATTIVNQQFSETAVGNPGNAAAMTEDSETAASSFGFLIEITLPSSQTVNRVTYDAYVDCTVAGDQDISLLVEDGATNSTQAEKYEDPGIGQGWISLDSTIDNVAMPFTDSVVRIYVFLWNTGAKTDIDIRVDNIVIYTNVDTYTIDFDSGGTTTYTLQRVTSLTSTSSWTDISPDTDVAPILPHDLAIDIIDPDIINVVDNAQSWNRSTNQGSAWTLKESSSDKRVALSAGNAILFGGNEEVVLSFDGTNFLDKSGNLAAVWGSIGRIKRIIAL